MARLGISRQTLYAYVSRGLLRATPAPDDPRRSRYDARDVAALLERRQRGRARKAVAASTIDWGEPVLPSRITRIADGRFFYRGRDALALAETATLEEVAALLWEAPGIADPPPAHPAPKGERPMERCLRARRRDGRARHLGPRPGGAASRCLSPAAPHRRSGRGRRRRRPRSTSSSPQPGACAAAMPTCCAAPWCSPPITSSTPRPSRCGSSPPPAPRCPPASWAASPR